MRIIRGIITLFVLPVFGIISAYDTYYMDEKCFSMFNKQSVTFDLGTTTQSSSSIILKATRFPPYGQSKNCTVTLKTTGFASHGVILSIREIDFSLYPTPCSDYIEIFDVSIFSPTKSCDFRTNTETYSRQSSISFLYHTIRRQTPVSYGIGFELTATAYSLIPCLHDEFPCGNGRCIWRGLKCDGRDNCGDNSDEGVAVCSRITVGVGSFGNYVLIICFGVLLGIVVLSSLVLFCVRARKLVRRPTRPHLRSQPPLPPYHTVYPSGYNISQNPAGPSPLHTAQGDGGISNPCYATGFPEVPPPPYKP